MTAKSAEHAARLLVIGLVAGLALAIIAARWIPSQQTLEIHGRIAEAGGWTPGNLTANVGEPLHLRLTSDDVMHGFAVGQRDWPAVDVLPGKTTEVTLAFERPGTYTFYCTRWCGLNHWRMRGTIEVRGPAEDRLQTATESATTVPPLYTTLGIDIDAPHPAAVVPGRKPSAVHGARLGTTIPPSYLTLDDYRSHSPAEIWQALRLETRHYSPRSETEREGASLLTDDDVWDLVAFVWQSNTTPEALTEGKALFAANCAACHGETGAGDGVMAAALSQPAHPEMGRGTKTPANFTDAASMLGASPALLQGKIIRGGMGTGMPYWGPIFTEAQTWALVDYLWTFQFETEYEP
jgi:mono/diheme cytochrome c family protein/plastocyanin